MLNFQNLKSIPIVSSILVLVSLSACNTTPDIDSTDWIKLSTDDFVFYSNMPLRRTVDIAENLIVFDKVIRDSENQAEKVIPNLVFIMTQDEFRALGLNFVGGLFTSKVGFNLLLVDGSRRLDSVHVMLHEYMHYLSSGYQYQRPLWLEEGLAEYFSGVRTSEEYLQVGLVQDNRMEYLTNLRWIPAEKLISASSYEEFNPMQLAMFYAQAWLLSFYLNSPEYGQEGRYQEAYVQYILNVMDDMPPVAAFESAFGLKVARINSILDRFLRRRSEFVISQVEKAPLINDLSLTPEPVSESEINLMMARIADAFDEEELATNLLSKEFLDNTARAVALGQLATLSASEPLRAHQLIEQSLALGPDNFEVQLAVAQAWLALAINTQDEAQQQSYIQHSRDYFLRAWRQKKTSPELFYDYGATFLVQFDDIDEAVNMLEEAYYFNPAATDTLERLFTAYALQDFDKATEFANILTRHYAHYSSITDWLQHSLNLSGHLHSYLAAEDNYKTWAAAPSGVYGFIHNNVSAENAAHRALELCDRQKEEDEQCQLIHSNGQSQQQLLKLVRDRISDDFSAASD